MSSKFRLVKRAGKIGVAIGGLAGGASVGFANAMPGERGEATKQGTIIGGVIGASTMWMPKVARTFGRGVQAGFGGKKAAVVKPVRKAMALGRYVFRRVGGRIIRMAVK
jgi:hypothetical protein